MLRKKKRKTSLFTELSKASKTGKLVFFTIKEKICLKLPKPALKRLPKVLVALSIGLVCVFAFLNRATLSPGQIVTCLEDQMASFGAGPGFPMHIVGNKVDNKNFKLMDGSAAILSDTAFVCINNSAKEIGNRQHSFLTPILKVSKNKSLVYDLYGTGLELGSKSKSIYKGNAENNIFAAAVADTGAYGLVTQVKGFTGKLQLFKSGKKDSCYEYCFSDCYITSLALSKNGKLVAAVGVSTQNGELISTVYIFDCKNETPKLKLDFAGSALFDVEYLSNNRVAVVGDNIFSVIDVGNGEKKDFLFENRELTAYDINRDKGALLSLSVSEDGNSCGLFLFDNKGNLENNIKTDLKIRAVAYNHKKLAAVSYGNVYIYNKHGKMLGSYDAGKDAKEVSIFSSRGVYILGLNEIRKVKI